MPEKNVLVTGGAGFIGANLVRYLLREGYSVRILDSLVAGRATYLHGLPVEFIEGDIRDREVVAEALESSHGVVHLAAQTGVPGSLDDPYLDCRVNVLGTLNLLEASRDRVSEVDDFVFVMASSNAVLGRTPPPAQEDEAPLPIAPYGASKLAGEGYALAYHGSWSVGSVILRFGNVYGPYCAHKTSVVAQFCRDVVNRGKVTIHGDGKQTRDFIYVDDLCRAIGLALEQPVGGEVFQIATGTETSIRRLAEKVEAAVQRNFSINHGPRRMGDVDRNYSEVTKALDILGWEPEIGLDEGLERTWNWCREFERES